VANDASFSSKMTVSGDASFNSKMTVSGDASFNSKMTVSGDASFNGNVTLSNCVYTYNSTGYVGIGKTSPGYTLDVSGTVGATSYNATSDYRIKANIILLSDTSFSVDLLKPVTYMNKSLGKPDIGFIAHEVQEQFPFLVNGEKDGSEYQTLNYNGLIGILTKEIQDLKKEIKEIRREFASYKS
jgi:hypothetical protein